MNSQETTTGGKASPIIPFIPMRRMKSLSSVSRNCRDNCPLGLDIPAIIKKLRGTAKD